jgi:hypothetical protein
VGEPVEKVHQWAEMFGVNCVRLGASRPVFVWRFAPGGPVSEALRAKNPYGYEVSVKRAFLPPGANLAEAPRTDFAFKLTVCHNPEKTV